MSDVCNVELRLSQRIKPSADCTHILARPAARPQIRNRMAFGTVVIDINPLQRPPLD